MHPILLFIWYRSGKNSKSFPFQAKKLNDLQQDLLKIVAGVANDGANFNETAVAHDWTDETAATYIVNKLGAYFPNAPITMEEVTGQKN